MNLRRTAAAALVPLLLAVSACAEAGVGSPEAVPSASSPTVQEGNLPPGWRWESYGGVEVGVPGDWGWDNGSQRLHQWCVGPRARIAEPVVGRPGVFTAVGCPGGNPEPSTLIANTGSVVAFNRTTEPPGVRQQGDRTAVRLDGVEVTVNAPTDLRRRIVATIRTVGDLDSYGCPTTHPVSTRPQQRPAKPFAVNALRNVSTISACKFGNELDASEPRLISSLRLDGAEAEQAIREIAGTPLGGGPDNPHQCMPDMSYGNEAIVLVVRSAAGRTEIVLRYSGCDHHGFDDGITVRTLTAKAVAPFFVRSNTTFSVSGGLERMGILMPEPTSS